jgi:hypothetical protein
VSESAPKLEPVPIMRTLNRNGHHISRFGQPLKNSAVRAAVTSGVTFKSGQLVCFKWLLKSRIRVTIPSQRYKDREVRLGKLGDGVCNSVLFFGRFRPNSPILPQNRQQIFRIINNTGSTTSSNEFGRSLKEYPFERKKTGAHQPHI